MSTDVTAEEEGNSTAGYVSSSAVSRLRNAYFFYILNYYHP